ncbi:MAG: hypothetical protein IJZ47_12000 [Oscillospiraceae bacterium]|nr:hypothetical protein [Oscillospiraceae bacterium]
MAIKVVFKDGTELAVKGGVPCYTTPYQGVNREHIAIRCTEGSISFDDLKAICSDSSRTAEITTICTELVPKKITNEAGEEEISYIEKVTQKVHYDMTLPVSVGYEMSDGEELMVMRLAQKTSAEKSLEQLASHENELAVTQMALIELASGGE